MNIHEYQATALLREYGVSVPNGRGVLSPQDGKEVAAQLGGEVWVVKSQIHAGGCGAGRFAAADDDDTHGIIMIGGIGGPAEEDAAQFVKGERSKKPAVGVNDLA